MKRGHYGKSPKGKGSNYHNKATTGDSKRRKSGGRGGASPHGSAQGGEVAPRRNRSRSGGFQEFGNFLWTFDATTNHWVARESDAAPAPSPSAAIDISNGGHSKAALKELSDFGREFPAAHKGKKGRGNNSNNGAGRKGQQSFSKSNPQASLENDDDAYADDAFADHAFIGFRSSSSPHVKSASPSVGSSFMMRFVKGETMNDEREKPADDGSEETTAPVEIKIERKEVKLEVEVKMEPRDSRVQPVRWQSEPAIPKYTPVVSHSRALGMPPAASTPQQAFSGRGRGRGGRGRGRGGSVANSPTSPADFHWSYSEKMLEDAAAQGAIASMTIKQEQVEVVLMAEPDDGTATATTTSATGHGKAAMYEDKQARKKNSKKNQKWAEKQLKNRNRIGLEPMESDSALFTTRDLVRARMQTGAYGKAAQRTKSSEDDEANEQADEDFLFGRGGRETRKGAPPVKGKGGQQPKGKKQNQKKGKKGFVYDMDDEDTDEDDDGMLLDDELIRDYMLNTELADLNLDEDAMEEHLLLHIVSQLNDYHLSDDEDDDDDDDEDDDDDDDDEDENEDEEEDEDDDDDESDEEDSEEDDSEEDIYDEYGDDEKEEEKKELAQKLKDKATKKTKKTPMGLAAWDDAETAVVKAAAEDETFDAVLNADFSLLRSDRPPSFQQRLRKPGGGGGSLPREEQRGSPFQRGNKNGNGKKWKTPEKGGRGRHTRKGKWYDQEFNEETITDEEELPYIDRTPLKGQPRSPSGMVTVHSINESIRNFIANDDKEWLELPPMNKKQRVMVHQLSQLYHLKSKSYGMGRHRFPTLVKTIYSCYPPQAELLTFLNHAAKIKATNGAPAPRKRSKEENKQLRKLKNMRKREGGKETFVSTKREMDGKVVGEGADPLGQETIGARLLQSMGWTGGGLVGTNGEGIAEPLMAIVKNNRKGLGF